MILEKGQMGSAGGGGGEKAANFCKHAQLFVWELPSFLFLAHRG